MNETQNHTACLWIRVTPQLILTLAGEKYELCPCPWCQSGMLQCTDDVHGRIWLRGDSLGYSLYLRGKSTEIVQTNL
jgi:hypothetical protein